MLMLISSNTTIWNVKQKVNKKFDCFNLNVQVVDLCMNRDYFGDLGVHHISYVMRHNDARGLGGVGGTITNDVLKNLIKDLNSGLTFQ